MMDVKSNVDLQKNVENESRTHELKLQAACACVLLDVFWICEITLPVSTMWC